MATKPIAISFGKKHSNSNRPSLIPNRKPLLSKKRLHDDDSDSEPESAPKATAVTGFDISTGGAIDENSLRPAKQARVIVGPRNRDWRAEIAKRRGGGKELPHEVERRREAEAVNGDGKGTLNGGPKAFGLVLTKSTTTVTEDIPMQEVPNDTAPPPLPKTDDELALEALTSANGNPKSTTTIIPLSNGKAALRSGQGESDTALFKTDLASRPDQASLQTYADVPIDGFGAALLRGMGWKDGQGVGKRGTVGVEVVKAKERRPALLGIGAKEGKGVPGAELGAWGVKGGKGRGKEREVYTPVVLRDRRTGEIVREDEIGKRKEDGKEEDWRERRDGRVRGEEDGERKRRSEKERDGGRDRDRDRKYSKEDRHRDDDRRRRDGSRDNDRRRKDQDQDRDRGGRRLLENERYSASDSRRREDKRDRDRERRRDREAVY